MSAGTKLVIIGATGRMGAALVRRYAQSHEVISLRRADLDLCHIERIRPLLAALDFDVLIYAAGITNVDYCEQHAAECLLTNAEAPSELATVCLEKNARFIHISTDYVFEGTDSTPRRETDPTRPICEYGKSKLLGEQAVLGISPHFLVIRVSWLFGPDKPSFPDMILTRALQSDQVNAIADKVSCPTYSEDLALWIEPMLHDPRYQGLLHLCNAGSSTWQHYGQTTLDIAARLGLPLRTQTVEGVSRRDFPTFIAQRPEFTAFDTTKYQTLSGHAPRPWEAALEEYLLQKYCLPGSKLPL